MPDKVLITGANGFIGYATTIEALEEGYHVIAAVRRQDAVEAILRNAPARDFHALGLLEFTIIPDMRTKDAFVKPSAGCTALIHIANTTGQGLRNPAECVEALLHACEVNASTVRRLVWTGSIAGITCGFDVLTNPSHPRHIAVTNGNLDEVPIWTHETVCGEQPPDSPSCSPFLEYMWCKAAGRRVLADYALKLETGHLQERNFDIVVILPARTLGPDGRARSQEEALSLTGSNGLMRYFFSMEETCPLPPMPTVMIHIEDVAKAHVAAVSVPVEKHIASYMLASDGPHGEDFDTALDIIRSKFPVLAQTLNPKNMISSLIVYFDASKAETDLLGRPFHPYSKQIIDAMTSYEKLPGYVVDASISKLAIEKSPPTTTKQARVWKIRALRRRRSGRVQIRARWNGKGARVRVAGPRKGRNRVAAGTPERRLSLDPLPT